MIMIVLLSVDCQTLGMGLDYVMPSPLLPVWIWFFLYIFICRSSLESSILFIHDCSANNCHFVVLMRGGELRVFLFPHLATNLNCFLKYSVKISSLP